MNLYYSTFYLRFQDETLKWEEGKVDKGKGNQKELG